MCSRARGKSRYCCCCDGSGIDTRNSAMCRKPLISFSFPLYLLFMYLSTHSYALPFHAIRSDLSEAALPHTAPRSARPAYLLTELGTCAPERERGDMGMTPSPCIACFSESPRRESQ